MPRTAKLIEPIRDATLEQLARAIVLTPADQVRNSKPKPKKTPPKK